MKILIFGAGGQGRVVLDILKQSQQYEIVGFVDSNKTLHGKIIDGLPVLGDISILSHLYKEMTKGAIIAIGDNRVRKELAKTVKENEFCLINAIHPDSSIAQNAQIGEGVAIAAGSIICAHAKIGNNAIINTGAIIEHECVIGDNVHIAPGVKIAGGTLVDDGTYIGIGSTIVEYLKIGKDSVIGAGSVIIEDVPDNVTVVGVPGKVIKTNNARPGS